MNKGYVLKLKNFSRDYMSLVAVILIFIVFAFASPYFFKLNNVINIFLQTATVGIVTIGQKLWESRPTGKGLSNILFRSQTVRQ